MHNYDAHKGLYQNCEIHGPWIRRSDHIVPKPETRLFPPPPQGEFCRPY
jgi:hypothetical protein